ncbi:MAG: hypothetical protein BWZ05_01479 [Bacteroidetes bacterium ADurb.BinA245]|jgi:hypothetical protein|nr:DUF1573 domain-containing protein [Chitinophagaceae bacterium]OPZ17298.1 MAG: hypothetical protein BWZ05_01479 [Bacteroidetes bacterium ADurb.BinA245]HNN99349.1 DUF1573 domain-containing protein [Chitinophagaceae bacterium]
MKKFALLATAFVFAYAANAQSKVDSMLKMNVETHDFGKIKQGIPVSYEFEIKNIYNAPIVVENAWASCGCTVPEKPTGPIAPGKSAKIKVTYNAAAVAPINKDVYIQLAGAPQPKTVHITGEVLAAEAYDKYVKDGGKILTKQVTETNAASTTPAKSSKAATLTPATKSSH